MLSAEVNGLIMNIRFFVFFSTIILFLFTSEAISQVLNVEKFRMDADTSNVWAGNLSFGFDLTKRSKQTLNLNNESDLVYLSRNHAYLLINDARIIKVDDNISNEGFTHLRATLFRRNTIAPELFAQYQYSQDWGLTNRILFGGTLRYMLVSSDLISVSLTTGGMYEYEKWSPENLDKVINRKFKSTNSLNVRGKLAEHVSILVLGYYQAPFQDFFSPRLTGDISFVFSVSRVIRFSAGFNVLHDAKPVEGVESWTYEFKNRLIISI